MIGKLTYEQLTEIINTLSASNESLKSVLVQYSNGEDAVSIKANKLLKFCSDVEQYIAKLNDNITLNKDVDNVINRLVTKNK